MGNRGSKKNPVDIIHGLSRAQRVEYLVFGYIRKLKWSRRRTMLIPDAVKLLCAQYLNMYIASATEQRREETQYHKICMLGAGAVGMSAIVIRLIADEFREDYDPTIEDSYRHHMEVEGLAAKLDILDTAGQDDFRALWTSWIRSSDLFIMCYSITARNTLEHLQTLWRAIHEVYEDDDYQPTAVLCGNKADLEHQRVVTKQEGEALAKKWNIPFVETSAKTGENVVLLFETLVKESRMRRGATS